MKVDFTLATKNSEKTIRKCLDHILKNIPNSSINKLIIVDNESTDSTLDILKEYSKKHKFIKVFTHKGLLGSVRLRQAQESSTEWIVIIDSDVYLYPNWWKNISPHLENESVGWVLGLLDSYYSEPYRSFFSWSLKRFTAVAFSNTAVRRKYILMAEDQLKNIHGNEDAPVFELIKSNGLKTVFVKDRFIGVHEGDSDHLLKNKLIRAGQSTRIRKGFLSALFSSFRLIFSNLFKVFLYSIENKTVGPVPKLLFLQMKNSYYYLFGVLPVSKIVREITR